jgi:hypothetical protein
LEADGIFDKASLKTILIAIKAPDSMILPPLLLYGRDQEIKTVAFGFLGVSGLIWSILPKSNF